MNASVRVLTVQLRSLKRSVAKDRLKVASRSPVTFKPNAQKMNTARPMSTSPTIVARRSSAVARTLARVSAVEAPAVMLPNPG